MLRKSTITLIIMTILAAAFAVAAGAQSSSPDASAGVSPAADSQGITKIKPSSSQVLKVRPYSSIAGFGGISQFNPMGWWQQCALPTPGHKQFVMGAKVLFARVHGEVRRGVRGAGTTVDSLVDFDDHLGLARRGTPIWTFSAHYQIQPRWGLRYSLTPIRLEANHEPRTAFTFGGTSFTAGGLVSSKWQRYEHRTGLVFDLSRTQNSLTSVFAEWLYIQDKLTVGGGTAGAVTFNDDKSMAMLGLEFTKCLKNYRGNTLAFNAKGGVAFLSDAIGYDAEASLNYLIPVKQGRFGFLKGGYRYSYLKKERAPEVFSTTLDGAFLEVGFLF